MLEALAATTVETWRSGDTYTVPQGTTVLFGFVDNAGTYYPLEELPLDKPIKCTLIQKEHETIRFSPEDNTEVETNPTLHASISRNQINLSAVQRYIFAISVAQN